MAEKNTMRCKERIILIVLLLVMLSGFGLSIIGRFADGLYAMIIGIIGYFLYNGLIKSKTR